jgi:hypothetical protein
MSIYLDTRGNSVLSVAICDRCNRKFAYVDLMPDPNFPGMRVCKDDLDNFDPWRLPARQTENIALRFPRPDQNLGIAPDLLNTQGAPNDPQQYNNFFLEGILPAAGAQGDLSTASNVSGTGVLPPSIGNVVPSSGSKAGGYSATINGSDFVGITNVTFGGEPASFTLIDSNTISVIVPAYGIAGTVTVAAKGPSSTAIAEKIFKYTP